MDFKERLFVFPQVISELKTLRNRSEHASVVSEGSFSILIKCKVLLENARK